MTSAALAAITAGTFSSACFSEYKAGEASVIAGETVACGTDGVGGFAPFCSGATRTDTVGQLCRAMCTSSTANTAQCQHDAQSYCEAYGGNPECACLNPDVGQNGITWGTGDNEMTWSQFQTFLSNNKQLDSVDAKCFWPPCGVSNKGQVFMDPQLLAPNICPTAATVKCIVGNVSVSLSGVTSNSVSIVNQQCGGSGVSGTSPSTKGATVSAPWGGWSTSTRELAAGGVALGLLLVIIIICFVVKLHRLSHATTRLIQTNMSKTVAAEAKIRSK